MFVRNRMDRRAFHRDDSCQVCVRTKIDTHRRWLGRVQVGVCAAVPETCSFSFMST